MNDLKLIEVELQDPDDFLKIKETLTRIGVASHRDKKLFQSCHILHKRGHYYIVHFKELFLLDGRNSTLSEEDLSRRNTVTKLLEDWGLVKVISKDVMEKFAPISQIKIVPYKDKRNWILEAKYTIGVKH